MVPRPLHIRYLPQVPLDKDSGELADGNDTTVITLPYGSGFNIYTGLNANGIEVSYCGLNLVWIAADQNRFG